MGVLVNYSSPPDCLLVKIMSLNMRTFLALGLFLLSTVSYQTEASPKVPLAGAKRAAGFDYDYYNPYAYYQQKRAPGFDYDYYNQFPAYQFQKRGSICLPFGMSCSVKGISCCGDKVECRCNLFNTNCKCQRASLFGR